LVKTDVIGISNDKIVEYRQLNATNFAILHKYSVKYSENL